MSTQGGLDRVSGERTFGRWSARERRRVGSALRANRHHETEPVQQEADASQQRPQEILVTFSLPDGSCHEGRAPRLAEQVVFIESSHDVPVGTVMAIRLGRRDDATIGADMAHGTVLWRCPSADDFKNRQGFGVRLQGRWLEMPASTNGDGECHQPDALGTTTVRGVTKRMIHRPGRLGRPGQNEATARPVRELAS